MGRGVNYIPNTYLQKQFPNSEMKLLSIEQELLEQDLYIGSSIPNDFHDSLFKCIFKLTSLFNVPTLRKEIAQTFCNYFFTNDKKEIEYLERYLDQNTIHQGYLVNLSKAYSDGKIGDKFAI